MEKVHITSQIVYNTTSWMTVEFRMHDSKTGVLKALMWTRFVHIDLHTGKPRKHSDELMEMFEEVLLPVEEKTFEERLHKARQGQLTLN